MGFPAERPHVIRRRDNRVIEGHMKDATPLHRHIHPHFIKDDGQPASVAFRPTENDNFKLSTYNGDRMTPLQAFIHRRDIMKNPTAGCMSVTVSQCQKCELKPIDDPGTFVGHALIEFPHEPKRELEKRAKRLHCQAQWSYQPTDVDNGP